MKKNLLLLVIMALFAACSNDNDVEFNPEEGYKFLKSLNVSDAQTIYKKGPSTRAIDVTDSLNRYYKIDVSGKEIELSITGADGTDQNIGIENIIKICNDYIIIYPNVEDLYKRLGYDPHGGDVPPIIHGAYAMLVNVKTEKMFKWTYGLLRYSEKESTVRTDKEGNVYFSPYNECLLKLNVKDHTLEELTDEGQNYFNFELIENGFIAYNGGQNNTYKIKCPGGRIYPVNGFGFMAGKKLYTFRDNKIYNLIADGTNAVKEVEICEFNGSSSSKLCEFQKSLNNPLKETVLLQTNIGCYEFDGASFQEKNNIPIDYFYYHLMTSQAWYKSNPLSLEKMSMKDYTLTTISLKDYEVQHEKTNPQSPDILFSGISYQNGDRVLGKITGNDEIIIESTTKQENDFIQLIPIN